MDKKFENALYMSGLTAQGCWDELDDYAKQAIIKFGECVVKETLQVAYAGLDVFEGEPVVSNETRSHANISLSLALSARSISCCARTNCCCSRNSSIIVFAKDSSPVFLSFSEGHCSTASDV